MMTLEELIERLMRLMPKCAKCPVAGVAIRDGDPVVMMADIPEELQRYVEWACRYPETKQ